MLPGWEPWLLELLRQSLQFGLHWAYHGAHREPPRQEVVCSCPQPLDPRSLAEECLAQSRPIHGRVELTLAIGGGGGAGLLLGLTLGALCCRRTVLVRASPLSRDGGILEGS